jgi:DNA-binding response OmpR family regulator
MTRKLSYEHADALVYDTVAANGETTRAALFALGFRELDAVVTLDQMAEHLRLRTPDLIVCEVAGAEIELCKLVQSLRQGLTGTNPFAAVIATTWRREGNLVNQVINSGADDLLARPFSLDLLSERLWLLVEQRKGFVVTCDYIGPDRRRDPRADGKNELLDVPNSLRHKAMGGVAREELDHVIAEAVAKGKAQVNAEKLRRDAFQLCLQWRLIEQRRPSARDLSDMLDRMGALAAEVKHRAAGTEYETIAKWCESVIECTEAIGSMLQFSSDADPSHGPTLMPMMHLLGHAALTLGEIYAPGEAKPTLLDELDAIAARIDIRRPAMQAVN